MHHFPLRAPLTNLLFRAALIGAVLAFSAHSIHAQTIPEFVGTQTCATCHESAAEEWEGSHHALAWTEPNAQTILGDFSDVTFTHQGVATRFYRNDDIYMIDTEGPDGKMTTYPVTGVVGITPLQQYLIETKPGTLQSFDIAWDVVGQTWFHLYPTQDLPAGDGYHWSGPYKNWNARCAECHATGFEKNYSAETKTYASTQAEIGVGCESCHGPGEAHVKWAEPDSDFDMADWNKIDATGFTIDLSEGGEIEVQQCATCHSRREPFGDGNPLPGTGFHDAYRLSPLRETLYHADGQILDEVYVYGSFLQSKMNAKGVTCTNCHNPHTAELKAEGNAVCTQCHSEAGNPDFVSLPLKTYDDPSHTFHPDGSDGAQCKNCHMIERTYMGVDGRRDHSFRIPRPDLTYGIETPNACNDCHDDKSAKWAAETLEAWFPDSTHRTRHYGQTFASARLNPTGNVLNLIEIAEYQSLPAIVRASALEILASISDPEIASRLEPLLEDSDPLVREGAISVQRGAPETERSVRLVGMLADPVKSVRIAAARNFLGMRIARMPDRMTDDLNNAMGEWEDSLAVKSDFPEAQLVLGGIGLTTRNMDAALAAFEEAVVLDPQQTQAWGMVIRIHAALEDYPAALEAANRAVENVPNDTFLRQLQSDLSDRE
ncbi:multiheme c-type cytochrome [Falsihalocynthiibacter sp. S25ZX9]|uniref:multiheme c-type cytochrome n=1 Tax=Falsihalocynthiibacter sp. S25ZX9 TaxID=3240870 RepID=UPI00350F7DB8